MISMPTEFLVGTAAQENERLKQLVADLSVAHMLLKKSQS